MKALRLVCFWTNVFALYVPWGRCVCCRNRRGTSNTYRYYDSIYSERYFCTPQENSEGYDKYAPISLADQLKGKFLLIHGTSDNNVYIQNSLELAEELVQHNKKFQMHMYTNRNHGIYGGKTRLHLYGMMTDFLNENLK